MIYLAVLIIGLVFSLLKGTSKPFFYSYLALLFILASFRYGVGPDYFAYEFLYSLVNTSIAEQLADATGQEILFRLFGSALNNLHFSYQLYISVTAFISLLYIGMTCEKYSPYPVFSLFLFYGFFYFVWVFSGIRQGLTLAIGVYYLLQCLESRKHIKFALVVFILTLIHASAAILFIFYILSNLNLKRKTLLIGIFFCFCVSLIPPAYLMEVFRHLPYAQRIEFYYAKSAGELTISYFDFKSISRLALLLLFGVMLSNKRRNEDEIQEKIVSLYLISFGIYYALRFIEILASNSSIYGFVLIILIMPNIYYRIKGGTNSKAFLAFCVIFGVAFFFKTLLSMEDYSQLNHSSLITPYTHIFDKSEYFPNAPQY